MATTMFLGALLMLLVWTAFAFNRLVRRGNLVCEAWNGIDVQLARRHDLVPNLVEVVQSYASFEKQLLTDVTRLRAEGRASRAPARRDPSSGTSPPRSTGAPASCTSPPTRRSTVTRG